LSAFFQIQELSDRQELEKQSKSCKDLKGKTVLLQIVHFSTHSAFIQTEIQQKDNSCNALPNRDLRESRHRKSKRSVLTKQRASFTQPKLQKILFQKYINTKQNVSKETFLK
jgi:hypothetical protein